jgi:1-hydroxycarotenoid 3,4-desaturase
MRSGASQSNPANSQRVVVVGAGIGGLVAAVDLASRGVEVVVAERAAAPGGKMREVDVGGVRVDAGPTVLTMRNVFEELFADARATLGDHVRLRPADVLARHAWNEGERLDLYADLDRTVDAIAAFASPAEGHRYRRFAEHARRTYETLERPFLRAARPSLPGLVHGRGSFGALWRMRPFASMWRALGDHFEDPRLRQLFARYATYCGASPFRAPATLMLIAHVEREGVWLVEGGMQRLADALAALATARGATLRLGTPVAEILVQAGRATGVRLGSGEVLAAAAVVVNADTASLAQGGLGRAPALALPRRGVGTRSLSAMTWALHATTTGFPLQRHNVFFARDYAAEFDDLFNAGRPPHEPTVYVCAQDRNEDDGQRHDPERLLCLINAPANGDVHLYDPAEVDECEQRMYGLLQRCGLTIAHRQAPVQATTPRDFERLFPGTGGALYGPASHGWTAAFRRQGARTSLPGLYVAGGSAHPGPGVPMAALSGRSAATAVLADLPSTCRSRPAATLGGTVTPSATTAAMP